MHRKGRQDKKRAQVFAKITREIIVAVKAGGPNPGGNSRLKLALQNARSHSMPKDNIERAIKKASGAGDTDHYEELRYEGFGPGGVAIMVEVLTDNRNRSAGDLRSLFTKGGGNMGENNSVAFMFQRVGLIHYPADLSHDQVFEKALEAGADDVESGAAGHDIFVAADNLHQSAEQLEQLLGPPEEARLTWRPTTLMDVTDRDKGKELFQLLEQLDDHDDVQYVITNYNMDEALEEQLWKELD